VGQYLLFGLRRRRRTKSEAVRVAGKSWRDGATECDRVRQYLLFGLRWRRRTRSEAVRVAGERDGGTTTIIRTQMEKWCDRVKTECDRVKTELRQSATECESTYYSDSDGEGEPGVRL
jgi:hypothetical protein